MMFDMGDDDIAIIERAVPRSPGDADALRDLVARINALRHHLLVEQNPFWDQAVARVASRPDVPHLVITRAGDVTRMRGALESVARRPRIEVALATEPEAGAALFDALWARLMSSEVSVLVVPLIVLPVGLNASPRGWSSETALGVHCTYRLPGVVVAQMEARLRPDPEATTLNPGMPRNEYRRVPGRLFPSRQR